MKTKSRSRIPTLLIAVIAAAVGIAALVNAPDVRLAEAATPTPAGGITPQSQLPIFETEMLEHAVNDRYYGLALSNALDTPWAVKIAYGGVFGNSNDTMVITAYRTQKLSWLAGAGTNPTPVPTYGAAVGSPGGMLEVWMSDTAGAGNATQIVCESVTGTALDGMTQGTNGGYVPMVTGKAGWLILNSNGTATLKLQKNPTVKSYVGCVKLPNGRVAAGASTGQF